MEILQGVLLDLRLPRWDHFRKKHLTHLLENIDIMLIE